MNTDSDPILGHDGGAGVKRQPEVGLSQYPLMEDDTMHPPPLNYSLFSNPLNGVHGLPASTPMDRIQHSQPSGSNVTSGSVPNQNARPTPGSTMTLSNCQDSRGPEHTLASSTSRTRSVSRRIPLPRSREATSESVRQRRASDEKIESSEVRNDDLGATSSTHMEDQREIRLKLSDFSSFLYQHESRLRDEFDRKLHILDSELNSVKAKVFQTNASALRASEISDSVQGSLADMNQRLGRMDQVIQGMQGQFQTLEGSLARFDQHTIKANKAYDSFESKFDHVVGAIGTLENRLNVHEQDGVQLRNQFKEVQRLGQDLTQLRVTTDDCMATLTNVREDIDVLTRAVKPGEVSSLAHDDIYQRVTQDNRYIPPNQRKRQDARPQDARPKTGYVPHRRPETPRPDTGHDRMWREQRPDMGPDGMWRDTRPHTPKATDDRSRTSDTPPDKSILAGSAVCQPKLPTFDGRRPWSTFMNMFYVRAEAFEWTDEAKFLNLKMCFVDKALDYFIKMRNQGKCHNFRDTVTRMEMRFDRKEDQQTLVLQFNNLRQTVDESIEDWSERVMTLGHEAFNSIAPEFVEHQIVYRFCTGCLDKDAAQHVLNAQVSTLEEALQRMKRYKENSRSIYGNSKKINLLSIWDLSKSPRSRSRGRSPARSPNRTSSDSKFGDHDSALKQSLEHWLSKTLKDFFESHSKSRSASPKRACFVCKSPDHMAPDCPKKVEGACYICKETSHKYMDCPQYSETLESNNQENSDRSGPQANARS